MTRLPYNALDVPSSKRCSFNWDQQKRGSSGSLSGLRGSGESFEKSTQPHITAWSLGHVLGRKRQIREEDRDLLNYVLKPSGITRESM